MPKICDECGAELKNENSKFCDKCGAKIKVVSNIDNKETSSNNSSKDNKKLIILGAIVLIAIVAVVGFTIFGQTSSIECKTVDLANGRTIDVPINSTHEKKNTIDYYKSDLAEVMIFKPPEGPVEKKTVDELTGLNVWTREYEDSSVQKDAELISGKMYDAIHYYEKANIDGAYLWHDETSGIYAIAQDGGADGYCLYAESTDPHVLAQIYNSMNKEDS